MGWRATRPAHAGLLAPHGSARAGGGARRRDQVSGGGGRKCLVAELALVGVNEDPERPAHLHTPAAAPRRAVRSSVRRHLRPWPAARTSTGVCVRGKGRGRSPACSWARAVGHPSREREHRRALALRSRAPRSTRDPAAAAATAAAAAGGGRPWLGARDQAPPAAPRAARRPRSPAQAPPPPPGAASLPRPAAPRAPPPPPSLPPPRQPPPPRSLPRRRRRRRCAVRPGHHPGRERARGRGRGAPGLPQRACRVAELAPAPPPPARP